MIEEIGKIKLDYSRYPGRDLYSDGAEDELLEIVRHKNPREFTKVIEERKSWPVLYHLSPLRENIIDWVPMTKTAKVLEVGSGCGAITGALSRKAGTVTCVELSKKRSLINAHRNRECDNVTIHVGNFKEIEPQLPRDFDFICLVGVFEYAQSYMGGASPYEDFLRILLSHLAADGRLLIAIENKYGLKYFAGCKEDHLGTYFAGIENYKAGGGARTFSREGLERIFINCGAGECHFYYPYPDYKFMTMLYSDEYLPRKGELTCNLRNFDRDRMLLFDEKSAYDGLVEDGLFPVFANSYLAVIGREFDTKFVKYSNDRAPEYAIRTEIAAAGWYRQRLVCVSKYPMSREAEEHVRGMAAAYESLSERYRGSGLEINRCELAEEEGTVCARFEYVSGVPLSELMDACLERNDLEGFYRYFRQYVERIGYNGEYPAADFDLVFGNIIVQAADGAREGKKQSHVRQASDGAASAQRAETLEEAQESEGMRRGASGEICEEAGGGRSSGSALGAFSEGVQEETGKDAGGAASEGALRGTDEDAAGASSDISAQASAGWENAAPVEKWTLIDYEWTFGRPIDAKELAYRAIYCYLLEDAARSRLKPELILKELSITEEMAEHYRQQEREFQRFVTGERDAMAQIRDKIGFRTMVPQKWIDRYQDSERVNRVQIYEDRGNGFSEEESYFVQEAYQGENLIHLKLQVGGDVKALRIDPSLCSCVVKINEMTFNGEAVPLEKRKVLSANGRIVRRSKKEEAGYFPSIVFDTEDPNIRIGLEGMERRMENTLCTRMEIVRLSMEAARDLADEKGMRLF